MPKQFSLTWVFEVLEEDASFTTRRMFGGLAAYYQGRMVACLTESPGDREYRGKKYAFDIWNGIMFPTEREHHASLQKDFPSLRTHPVLPKWLYLPMSADDFETDALALTQRVAAGDARLGIEPKPKKKSKPKLK